MESKVRFGYDAVLALVAPGTAAITADTTSAKVDINRIANGRGDIAGRYGAYDFAVVVHMLTAFHGTDEVYSLEFWTFDSAGLNGVLQEAVAVGPTDAGKTLVYSFDTATLAEKDTDAALFGIVMNVTGTLPSSQFWAYISPNY